MARKPSPLPPVVTFLTDFGTADGYVVQMKAQVLRQAPSVRLLDVTHEIGPQDVMAGSLALERAVAAFWPGTIHVAVVDPGVGSHRRILIAQIRDQWVICPDNGLISWPWIRHGPGKVSELLWRPKSSSATFHGRDIMAPAAGMLAARASLGKIAAPIDDPVLLDLALAGKPLKFGKIIHIDRFGNSVTNIPKEIFERGRKVRVRRHRLGEPKQTYSEVGLGKPVALFGSSGLLEIAVRNGSAAKQLGLHVNDVVVIE